MLTSRLSTDFGSWVSLVELNLGTNQLSKLPGKEQISLVMKCNVVEGEIILFPYKEMMQIFGKGEKNILVPSWF